MLLYYKLYKHVVQASRLNLLQLLQSLGLEGDLTVEVGEVGGDGALLGDTRISYINIFY